MALSISNSISNNRLPYSAALANLQKGGLTGNNLTMATNSLANAYKAPPAPVATQQAPTAAAISSNPAPVKGVLPTSYGGLIGSLAGASQPSSAQNAATTGLMQVSPQNSTQTGLIQDLRNTAAGNANIGTDARNISSMYGGEINRIGQLGAAANAAYGSTGSNVVGEGNAAIASANTSARMNALGLANEAALQGTAQQLTGQNQQANAQNAALTGANTIQSNAISGFNSAGGLANTQQANTITGLNAATGYAQPVNASPGTALLNPQTGEAIGGVGLPTSYGQTTFDPATGTFSGGSGGNLDPQQAASDLAQKVISGQLSYEQAVSSLGYAGSAGQQFLNNAIKAINPSFNAPQSSATIQGQAAGTQAVESTQGTIQAEQAKQIADYKSSAQQGQQLASQLNDLITSFNLNPNDVNVANAAIQKIAANTSDPRYQKLSNYLNDVASRYAQVLTPPGGNATDMTRSIASSMINATASGKSIKDVLASLDQQAQAVISAVPATGNVPGGQTQVQNGATTSAGGFNFIFQNGKWVPK